MPTKSRSETQHEYYLRNRDRLAEYHRARYAAKRDEIRERQRVYEASDARAAYLESNRERRRAATTAWQKANPEKVAEIKRRRTAARQNAPINDFTDRDWQELLAEYKNRCAYCGEAKSLIREHKTPLSRGGSNTKSNIVPSCRSCNSRKGTKTAEEFQKSKSDSKSRRPAPSRSKSSSVNGL